MLRLQTLIKFLIFTAIVFPVSSGYCAEEPQRSNDYVGPFEVSAALQGRVEFWRLVFTKYGKEDVVFHHRKYPEIIYSVLDFSDFRSRYPSDRLYQRKRREVVDKEEDRIEAALRHLATGKGPRNDFESRIVGLFDGVGLDDASDFKEAAEPNMVRGQTGIRERFRDGIRRSGRYLPAIEEVFIQAGLPPELGRLPLVESSFDYDAYSSAGAAGIWQFTRSTGKRYMRINSAVDERRDPISATRAAASYLQNAYEKLGKWPLAVTSYNHGLQGVMRAVEQTGSRDLGVIAHTYKGRTFGFASSNFYAEFIAAVLVEREWRKYFPDLQKEEPKRFDAVELKSRASYKSLVTNSGFSEEEFRHWNPALLQRVRSGSVGVPSGVMIYVRKGDGTRFADAIGQGRIVSLQMGTQEFFSQSKPKPMVVPTNTYRVRSGDTVGQIARRFGVSQRSLMHENNIRNPRSLRAGQTLNVPYTQTRDPGRSDAATVLASSSSTYVVQKGDNLSGIASSHGMSLSELRKLNPKLTEFIYPGQKLSVARYAEEVKEPPVKP
ncbi:MAG: LysM peptidoglycan-binding domain-containing protein, partial [Bdellovibrionales bacterium]|nr:LysM peptidoglycan-binding domain-containing protein [Bdellovibrionales bacterium]